MPPLPIPDTLTLEAARAAPFLPGHQPGETVILKAWLADQGHRWTRFGFNVRIGVGVEPPENAPEYARRFVRATTRKRIDVVAFTENTVSLFEVKIQANLGALGQMLGYRHLWEQEFPAWPVDAAGIICWLISADTAAVYTRHNMPFFLYHDVPLPPLTYVPPLDGGTAPG